MLHEINTMPLIKTEFDLVSLLADNLQSEFNTDVSVREFSAGYGIADLVFARDFLSDRNALNRKPINNYYALQLYLSIPVNQTITSSKLKQLSPLSGQALKIIVKGLIQDGYLQIVDENSICKALEIKTPVKKLVAIEAKLRDWKQGILQARRYKSFTDECYLAILAKYDKNIDYGYLERFDIGLILCDEETGMIELKRKPVITQEFAFYKDETNIYAKEVFLASI